MKSKILFVFILSLIGISIILSCNKKDSNLSKLNGSVLTGSWEIRGLSGPLIDVDPNAFAPGNGNIWAFNDPYFAQRINDSVYKGGTYTVDTAGFNPIENKQVQRFVFNGVPEESFELRNDTLFVYSIATDQFQYRAVYVKLSLEF